MDKVEIYKLVHYAGIFLLMFSFGAMFTNKEKSKLATIGHGVGLLLILVGGFGMQAVLNKEPLFKYISTYGTKFPMFLILKLVIWFGFGAALVLAKKKILKGLPALLLILLMGLAAAFLGLKQPMLGNAPASPAAPVETPEAK